MKSTCALFLAAALAAIVGCKGDADRSGKNDVAAPSARPAAAAGETTMDDKVTKTDEQWRRELTPEQYHVMREKGTERAFTGKYWDTKSKGVYRCAACGAELFRSDQKFDSGCGWPSFTAPAEESRVAEHADNSHGMVRTEVTCNRCGAHLGHVFDDGPAPTGLRYCINSVSIDLKPEGDGAKVDGAKGDSTKVDGAKGDGAAAREAATKPADRSKP